MGYYILVVLVTLVEYRKSHVTFDQILATI